MTRTRVTKQKKVIVKILQETTSHPTADWIYEEARKVLPDISLGTVYRNLRVLTEAGVIRELNYGSTYSRYDGNASNHYHFVCLHCNQVLDIPVPVISDLEARVEDVTGHQVDYHRTELYGICRECLERDGHKEEA